mgnify:CR=1 FL=1
MTSPKNRLVRANFDWFVNQIGECVIGFIWTSVRDLLCKIANKLPNNSNNLEIKHENKLLTNAKNLEPEYEVKSLNKPLFFIICRNITYRKF